MRRNVRCRDCWLVLGTGIASLMVGWGMRSDVGVANRSSIVVSEPTPSLVAERVMSATSQALAVHGAAQLESWHGAVREARTSAALRSVAARLLADPTYAASESLWALLMAQWSEIDPEAMIAFAETPGRRSGLAIQKLAFYAWAAVDPRAAVEVVRHRSKVLRKAALEGMAQTQPQLAAELALKMPDGQFALGDVVRSGRLSPTELEAVLPNCFYDGSRAPAEEAMVKQLAESDPEAALAAAQKVGRIWGDQVANAIRQVAQHDTQEAMRLLATLPDSRQRVLASVSLAKVWAVDDAEAALTWVRDSLQGPARQSALLEIADTIGGVDPGAGLALIEEVGWDDDVEELYEIAMVRKGRRSRPESHQHVESAKLAESLIRQLATIDEEAARAYINKSPEEFREKFRKASGLNETSNE